MNILKKIKKIHFILIICFTIFFANNVCFAINIEQCKSIINLSENSLNRSLNTVVVSVFLIFVLLFILGLMTKENKCKVLTTQHVKNNQTARILEVILLIAILIFLGNEFLEMYNLYYTSIGLIMVMYTFYQRVSNKNRRYAYITILITTLFYLITSCSILA